MVLQSEIFPGGYQHQSYSNDGYYSTGYGQGTYMPTEPIPSFNSPHHMMPSSGYGPHHHRQPGWNNTSTEYYSHASNGHVPSHFSTGNSFSHGMATAGFGSSFHGATHGHMGSKVESMKHEYSSYGNGRPSMFSNPMHGGYQSAEWKLKSIEDDD